MTNELNSTAKSNVETRPITAAELTEKVEDVVLEDGSVCHLRASFWKCRYLNETPEEEITRLNALFSISDS